jgi:hypothetical protein
MNFSACFSDIRIGGARFACQPISDAKGTDADTTGEITRCRFGIAQLAKQTYACGMRNPSPDIEAARRAGIDLDLVDENLCLSFEQRVLQHQDALDFALEIERAGRKLRERSATTPAAAG